MQNIDIFTKEEIKNTQTITTLEIAKMMDTEHKEILKKLEGTKNSDGTARQVGIIPTLAKGKIPLSDYFFESSGTTIIYNRR